MFGLLSFPLNRKPSGLTRDLAKIAAVLFVVLVVLGVCALWALGHSDGFASMN